MTLFARIRPDRFDIQVDLKKDFTMFAKNVGWKSKIFKVKMSSHEILLTCIGSFSNPCLNS